MPVKFLSEDWIEAVVGALASHNGFKDAAADTELGLQFVVDDAPSGVTRYYVNIAGGAATAAIGETEAPDATINNDYETAVAISKGDLNTQAAFIAGRLKVDGNLAKIMMSQEALSQFASALSGLDIDY